jgi:glutamine synthetase
VKALNIACFVHDPKTGTPYSRDPRAIARKAQKYLMSTGIGDTAYFAPEAEFYIFDDVRFETKPQSSYFHLDSHGASWNTGREEGGGNQGYKTPSREGTSRWLPPTTLMIFATTSWFIWRMRTGS